jgi:hypothetical protein
VDPLWEEVSPVLAEIRDKLGKEAAQKAWLAFVAMYKKGFSDGHDEGVKAKPMLDRVAAAGRAFAKAQDERVLRSLGIEP